MSILSFRWIERQHHALAGIRDTHDECSKASIIRALQRPSRKPGSGTSFVTVNEPTLAAVMSTRAVPSTDPPLLGWTAEFVIRRNVQELTGHSLIFEQRFVDVIGKH
jgi:hypothetical protein